MDEQIIHQAMALPYDDRLRLAALLTASTAGAHPRCEPCVTRGAYLMSAMEEVAGYKLTGRQTQEQFWAKAIVAHQLLSEGYTTVAVGRLLGRDHASIIHAKRRMQDALSFPAAFRDVNDLWINFQNFIRI